MDVSDYIALGSLIVSIFALGISFFADKRAKKLDILLKQKDLEKKNQEEADEKKADIEVNMVQSPKGKLDFLRFYNKGLADAININFEITSDPEDHISLNIGDEYLPYPKLVPQQNFDVYYHTYSQEPPQTILITWSDEYGKNRSKEMVIDM